MQDLLKSRIKELETEIGNVSERLNETKKRSNGGFEHYYYENFAEEYTELNK